MKNGERLMILDKVSTLVTSPAVAFTGDSRGGLAISVSGSGSISAQIRLEVTDDPSQGWTTDDDCVITVGGTATATDYIELTEPWRYIRATVLSLTAGAVASVVFGNELSGGTGLRAPASIVRSKRDPVTGVIKNPRLSGFVQLLEKKGVVANGVSDDASAFQEAILAARSEWGGAFPIPAEISTIKINSGITIDSATDCWQSDGRLLIDASGVTSGAAITVSGSLVNNDAAVQNMMNGLSRIKVIGAGGPAVPGAAGVVGIKFRGTGGKAYFYNVKNCVVDGFETNIDLAGNSFGICFDHLSSRAAMGGTIVRCLAGDGSDYGENYHFIGGWLGNSARAIYNTNSAATFHLMGVSLDYCDVMVEMAAGALAGLIYCETNLDTDYMFKCHTSETAAITLMDGSSLTFNAVHRTKFEPFYVDAAVKFGGIYAPGLRITHGGGYSLPMYGKGDGRILCPASRMYVNETKPPVSQWMSSARKGNDANSLAEWTLTGTTPPALDASTQHNGASTFKLSAQAGVCQLERIFPCGADQHPRFSFYYQKTGSTAGQGKLQVTGAWLDSKGTVIGATTTIDDIDGNTAGWVMRVSNINAPRPNGATQYRLRILKSADAGAVGNIWISQFVGGPM